MSPVHRTTMNAARLARTTGALGVLFAFGATFGAWLLAVPLVLVGPLLALTDGRDASLRVARWVCIASMIEFAPAILCYGIGAIPVAISWGLLALCKPHRRRAALLVACALVVYFGYAVWMGLGRPFLLVPACVMFIGGLGSLGPDEEPLPRAALR